MKVEQICQWNSCYDFTPHAEQTQFQTVKLELNGSLRLILKRLLEIPENKRP